MDIFNAKSVRASRGTLFSLRYMLRVSTTKASSGDGDGKEKLAVLGKVLKEQGYLCVGGVGAANSSQGTSRTPLRRIEDPSVVSWILEHPNVALVSPRVLFLVSLYMTMVVHDLMSPIYSFS